jgi:hypothetical protein
MPCELAILKNAKQPYWKTGNIVEIRDTPCDWGAKVTLPNWIIIEIPDATAAEMAYLIDEMDDLLTFTITNETPLKYTVKIEGNPGYLSRPGMMGAFQSSISKVLLAINKAKTKSRGNGSIVIEITKPANMVEIQAEIYNKIRNHFIFKKYSIEESEVNQIAAGSGRSERAKSVLMAKIKNDSVS